MLYIESILRGGEVAARAWYIRARMEQNAGMLAHLSESCEDCHGAIPAGSTIGQLAQAMRVIVDRGGRACQCPGVERMHLGGDSLRAHGIEHEGITWAPPGEAVPGRRAD